MAKTLNLDIVAEGVETKSVLQFLKANRCPFYQGYLCSPPVTADAFVALLDKECTHL
jgi:EAL domain-containing protein (putative c-di-GMP-specific phosphodiesterase class I)